MRPADVSPECPVCALPAGDEPYCFCGWEMHGPLRLGPVTAVMRADFDQRLAAARRAFDARAAALVSPDPARLARWLRGGAPDGAQWAAARRQAAADRAGSLDEESARKELAAALRGLAPGRGALIIEIGPEGISVIRAVMDETGTPAFAADRPAGPWPELLPALPADEDERLLRLAGGYANRDQRALRGVLGRAIPAADGDEVLVICRPAGWALLEAAAALASLAAPGSRLLRVAADADWLPRTAGLGTLTSSMPLLRGYGVIVAAVDPVTGEVSPATRPLFQPGDVPGAVASVNLRRFPGGRERATLAVAVDAAWSVGPQVVAVHSVPQQERPAYRVSAVLEGSGRVRFTEPGGVTDEGRPWPAVWAGVPRRVDVRPTAVDLVCAIELTGGQAQVARRKTLVRELLEEIAREYPNADSPRVGLAGCLDHVYAPGEEKKRVTRGIPLGPAADALTALAGLRGAEISYPDAAPVEDLLHDAYRMLAGSRAAGRTGMLLLVVGRRPHPPVLTVNPVPGGRIVQPCPLGRDWSMLARQLGEAGVRVVAVADVPPSRGARAAFWAEAGRDGLHALADATARSVGEDIGLFVREGQLTGLPLPA